MITIEEYRAKIGCFCHKAQKCKQKYSKCTFENYRSSLSYPVCLQIFVMFIFILTLRFNINMTLKKLSMLLIDGDIESNPGPDYKIQKTVSGSFHQGHVKFGYSAGTQCSCNALYAICYSSVKKVSIWKYWDVDYILEHGDAVFKSVGILRSLSMNELPNNVQVENNTLKIEMLDNFVGLLGYNSVFANHVSLCDIGNGLIFTTAGYCISLIWSKNSIVLFDSHSRDNDGCFTDAGNAVLLFF